MRIKLGRPMLLRQIAGFSDCNLFVSEDASCQTAVSYLTTDTREVMPGDIFVALITEKDNGHNYLSEARRRGASAALIREDYAEGAPPMCLLTARDTMEALVTFASSWARSIPHRTVAITGSVGKTTTRHLLACILRERYCVHETEGNFNNLFGTALTLLSMPPESEYLVAECGMDAPGQISRISGVLRPDVSVITGIGISHLEKMKTKEAIYQAKLEILDGMRSNGAFFCPSAEPLLCHMTPVAPHTFSAYDSGADYHIGKIHPNVFGMQFDLITPDKYLENLYVPILSETLMPLVSCAAGIALCEDISPEQLRRGLSRYKPLPMRQNRQSLGKIQILLDCYNACPSSMKAAGESALHLQSTTGSRIIALLGDMTELGSETESGHRETGAYMAKICDSMFCIGEYADLYTEGARTVNEAHVYPFPPDADRNEVARQIADRLQPSDILLIKGSRKCRLELFLPILQKMLL